MAKKRQDCAQRKRAQGRSGADRDRAQWRHCGDGRDEDQSHAHRLQHDHLRGARLHHRPVHGRRRHGVDRHRPAELHPRHVEHGEARTSGSRHEAGRHLRHQRRLHDRQPSQSFHLHVAGVPQGQARRLFVLHGALDRRRRHARRYDHRHFFRRSADPDHQVSGPRRRQPDAGRHHPPQRAPADPRHGRPARAGDGGEDRRAAFPAVARPLRSRAGARRDQDHHGPCRGAGAGAHAHHSRWDLRGRVVHGRRRHRDRQAGADPGEGDGQGRADDHRPDGHRRQVRGFFNSGLDRRSAAPRWPTSA